MGVLVAGLGLGLSFGGLIGFTVGQMGIGMCIGVLAGCLIGAASASLLKGAERKSAKVE